MVATKANKKAASRVDDSDAQMVVYLVAYSVDTKAERKVDETVDWTADQLV